MVAEKVSLRRFDGDYSAIVESILDAFPAVVQRAAGKTVLLKPNYWSPDPSGSGSVTDVKLVVEIARSFLRRGAKRVIIAEGAAVGFAFKFDFTTTEALEKAGLVEAVRDLPVDIIDLHGGDFCELQRDDYFVFDRIQVARPVIDCDVLINIPVIKTHIRTRTSLGMKNLKGVVSPREKKRCHKLGLEEGIVDINSAVKPDLTIVDGITGIEGLWDVSRDSVNVGCVLAGTDIVAVDSVGARVMGIDPRKVMFLRLAEEKGLGRVCLDDDSIDGPSPAEFTRKFKLADEVIQERFPQLHMDIAEACTGCVGCVTGPLVNISDEYGAEALSGLAVIAGYTPPEDVLSSLRSAGRKLVIVGNCARESGTRGHFLKGCPPDTTSFHRLVEDIIKD